MPFPEGPGLNPLVPKTPVSVTRRTARVHNLPVASAPAGEREPLNVAPTRPGPRLLAACHRGRSPGTDARRAGPEPRLGRGRGAGPDAGGRAGRAQPGLPGRRPGGTPDLRRDQPGGGGAPGLAPPEQRDLPHRLLPGQRPRARHARLPRRRPLRCAADRRLRPARAGDRAACELADLGQGRAPAERRGRSRAPCGRLLRGAARDRDPRDPGQPELRGEARDRARAGHRRRGTRGGRRPGERNRGGGDDRRSLRRDPRRSRAARRHLPGIPPSRRRTPSSRRCSCPRARPCSRARGSAASPSST